MAEDPTIRAEQLKALASDLRRIDPDREYYQVTITATAEGKISWSAYTHFVDFTDETARFEIREASIIKAQALFDLFSEMGERCVVVNDDRTLSVFLTLGGHALVERSVAEHRLKDVIAPSPVARSGVLGFRGLESVPKAELQHAPTRKQRLRILKRDEYRCRICGERPADNVHIKLHVHHIRMWSRGGLTEDRNLITICETCHDGLEPHEDWSLFDLVPGSGLGDQLDANRKDYADSVRRYRELVKEVMQRERTDSRAAETNAPDA